MFLVEILFPVSSQKAGDHLRDLMRELSEAYGGVTAFSRSPAEGLWTASSSDNAERDDIIVLEVMVDDLDRTRWAETRERLERLLGQEELVVRATKIERL